MNSKIILVIVADLLALAIIGGAIFLAIAVAQLLLGGAP